MSAMPPPYTASPVSERALSRLVLLAAMIGMNRSAASESDWVLTVFVGMRESMPGTLK